MQNPAEPSQGICPICRGFPGEGYSLDYGCGRNPDYLDAVAMISYAPGLGQLHTALRHYKDSPIPAIRQRFQLRLAAVLWRFLDLHEACVAKAAGLDKELFDVVCVVPSKTKAKDDARPGLREIVGSICKHTAPRFERLVVATDRGTAGREFDPDRYVTTRRLDGEDVLLIDDMWTTGASAQNAAYSLKQAGANTVGFVAIGRYIRRDWEDHGARLDALPKKFRWDLCPVRGRASSDEPEHVPAF
jgi:predicted amidophosphoribosyltransferase